MAKIDFDSDSAPFTGSVLPTIEDVAMLSVDDGKYEVSHEKRSPEQKAAKVQSLLLPATIFFGVVALSFFYATNLGSPARIETDFNSIPFDKARDIRIVEKTPSEAALNISAALVKQGRKVVFFHENQSVPSKSVEAEGVDFYPVPSESLGENGILLDGYKWFPLPP